MKFGTFLFWFFFITGFVWTVVAVLYKVKKIKPFQ